MIRRSVSAITERGSVITRLEAHGVVTIVTAVGVGEAIRDDIRRGVRGKGGGEGRQVIGLGRLSRLACLPESSPELFTFTQLVLETGVILLELGGFLSSLATGVLELEDDGLEGCDWGG